MFTGDNPLSKDLYAQAGRPCIHTTYVSCTYPERFAGGWGAGYMPKILTFWAFLVIIKLLPIPSMQRGCYDIKPVRKEEGKSYWKIPLCDDDATREK